MTTDCIMCLCVSGGAGRGQHDWGAGGQRLVGEILDDVVLPHQFEDPRQLAGQSNVIAVIIVTFLLHDAL